MSRRCGGQLCWRLQHYHCGATCQYLPFGLQILQAFGIYSVQVGLLVLDEIHLLGNDRCAVLPNRLIALITGHSLSATPVGNVCLCIKLI